MIKIFKYLKSSIVSVLAIILLLFVQAYLDLTLPDYTSKIVNIGVQQAGIEDAAITEIGESSLNHLLLFMNDDDKNYIMDSYTESDDINGEKIYKLKKDADKTKINDIYRKPMTIISFLNQSDKNIFFAPGPVINNISKNTLEKIFSINPILHLNEKEALEFTKKDNINDSILKLYELTKNVVFITVGERGVIFYDGKNITHIEGEKVKVVDTIGAGDSHIGAIISAYSLWANKMNLNYSWKCYLNENNGENFINGCKLSNKVASEVVQVQGAKISKECFNKFNI